MDTDLAEFFLVCIKNDFMFSNYFNIDYGNSIFFKNQNAKTEPYKSLGVSLKKQKPSLTLTNYSVELYDVLLDLNGAYAQVFYN